MLNVENSEMAREERDLVESVDLSFSRGVASSLDVKGVREDPLSLDGAFCSLSSSSSPSSNCHEPVF